MKLIDNGANAYDILWGIYGVLEPERPPGAGLIGLMTEIGLSGKSLVDKPVT